MTLNIMALKYRVFGMLNIKMLNVIMLSVIMLNVVTLSVVAPFMNSRTS